MISIKCFLPVEECIIFSLELLNIKPALHASLSFQNASHSFSLILTDFLIFHYSHEMFQMFGYWRSGGKPQYITFPIIHWCCTHQPRFLVANNIDCWTAGFFWNLMLLIQLVCIFWGTFNAPNVKWSLIIVRQRGSRPWETTTCLRGMFPLLGQ